MAACRGCGVAIRWVATAATGKLMPLNAEPDPAGNVLLDDDGRAVVLGKGDAGASLFGEARYMPHHATCEKVDEFR